MKIYACYSPSHAPLVEQHLIPSIPTGFELILREVSQHCPSGSYGQPGWQEAMGAKIEMIRDAIKNSKNHECFIACDADVRFHRLCPTDVSLRDGTDIAYALDYPIAKRHDVHYCAGFAVIRPSRASQTLYDLLHHYTRLLGSEQKALHQKVLPIMQELITVEHLPPDRFWSLPHPVPISYNLAAYHASWVHGVNAKLGFLDAVKNLLETFPCS